MHLQLQQQSRLLQLPTELQLTIFEYAVVEDHPLLLNCGCDSSYKGDEEAWCEAVELWKKGEKLPPFQPGITSTCSIVRRMVLPIFYQRNVFRAHYCYRTDFDMAVKWLKMIGKENRLLLRDFCFWDLNPDYDWQVRRDLWEVKRSDVFRTLGGSMETLKVEGCCCHHVTFGEEGDDYVHIVSHLFEGLATGTAA